MPRAALVFLLIAMTIPAVSISQTVNLKSDLAFDSPVKIGNATGRFIKRDEQGVYVSVPKSADDDETRQYIAAYKHGEWDAANWLLLIPHAAINPDGLPSRTLADSTSRESDLQCYLNGKKTAKKQVGTTGNFLGGLAGGLLLGYLGAGIAVISAGSADVPFQTGDHSDGCNIAFTTGYGEEGQSKKRLAAARGGILGSAVLITIALIAANN
jgi:hypothetical protein